MDDPSDSAARDDGATFAPVGVRASRRPRAPASVVVVAVAAMVALGVLHRGPDTRDTSVVPAASVASATVSAPQRPMRDTGISTRFENDPTLSPEALSGQVLDLDVRR